MVDDATSSTSHSTLPHVRLRPPRHARPLPGVRYTEDHSMKRKLFTFFSALTLLLCVAVCVLWVRSYWRDENRWGDEFSWSATVPDPEYPGQGAERRDD